MKVHAHMLVQGLVQGVGFRYFVLHHAQQYDLHGFVKNLYSGDVEIDAEGERASMELFIQQVKLGPRHAHIANIDLQWLEPTHRYVGFEVED